MSQQNPNLVAAELVATTTELPTFEVRQSRGVDVASIVRTDIGTYEITLTRAIPVGSLHVTTGAHDTGTGTPRHLLVEQIGPATYRVRCYTAALPPVLVEDSCFWRIVWHSSPEVAAVVVPLEPLIPPLP